jgi:hypothetical protein
VVGPFDPGHDRQTEIVTVAPPLPVKDVLLQSYGVLLARSDVLPQAVLGDWRVFQARSVADNTFFAATSSPDPATRTTASTRQLSAGDHHCHESAPPLNTRDRREIVGPLPRRVVNSLRRIAPVRKQ